MIGPYKDRLDAWRYAAAYPRVSYPVPALELDFPRLTDAHEVRRWDDWMKPILEKERKQMRDFTLKDIRSGFVVALRDGSLWLVARAGENFERILVNGAGSWGYLDKSYNNDLTMKRGVEGVLGGNESRDIVKVYGLVSSPRHWQNAASISSGLGYRPLLWARREVKKLTVAQVSDLLGYDVEIVAEDKTP